ncbi:ABC transporter substrate-binding protein [Spirilliplanes yamanashiensis]|uniref:Branched-chain amino acid ABC transporter n=1 Tax=Spirilliplanes yamanashiensis TaxID=42233 RepID=A0A8J3YA50_9ACTN|nr:ABC transporter substrate-binding protein [Spirilliplanes yamanashiensis]MDP9815906.1 branched-chain amino acid transport system substrate-binding protein [Spirilliplanes yamanashiensis]GIJ04162.1 branched-chain amino acid ABC transporter [Spirilliplanes yamanashiensis]
MRPTRSLSAALAVPALLVGLLTGCSSDDEGGNADVYIGADLELSGAAAPIGAAYERAIQLKVEQVNASGVLGGRTLKVRVTDNRSDPTSALRNIGSFTEDPNVAAVITGVCSECAIGAAKTVNDRRVPTIALAPATAVATPVAERRFMFKLAPNAADSAAALVTELRAAGAKKVAVLHTGDLYGRGGLDAMGAELSKAGIEMPWKATVKPTDNEIADTVAGLVANNPDSLVVWTFADQAAQVAAAARAAGFTGGIYLDAAAAGDLFLPRSATKGTDDTTMVFTQTLVIDDVVATTPAKAARKQWFRDYTSRYGDYSGSASFAADAVQLIANAVANVGGDRERIREVLETSQTDGLSGPIRMTPDNHSGLMPQAYSLLVVRGGRWRLAG